MHALQAGAVVIGIDGAEVRTPDDLIVGVGDAVREGRGDRLAEGVDASEALPACAGVATELPHQPTGCRK